MEEREKQQNSRRENANILSKVFFCWMTPLLTKGYRKDLEEEDLFEAEREDQSKVLGDLLEVEWKKEQDASHGGKKKQPSLFKALLRSFGGQYAFLGLFTAFEECVIHIYQPLFLGRFGLLSCDSW